MKDKQTDLAAGRLGISPPQGSPRARPSGKKTNYGVERLGISSPRQALAAPRPAAPAPSQDSVPEPAGGRRAGDRPPSAAAPAERPGPRGFVLDLPPFTVSVTRFSRRQVYAGICGITLVIGVTCFMIWHSAGGGGTPRSAAASVPPLPPAQLAARPAEEANRLPAAKAPQVARADAPRPSQPGLTAEISQLVIALTKDASARLKARQDELQSGAPAASSPAPPAPPVADAENPAPAADAVPSAASRPAAAPQRIGYKVAPDGIVVSGIFRGPAGPVAVINNQFLKVGETFDQIKVTRIDDYAVELEEGGQRFLVSLSSGPSRAAPEKEEPAEEELPPPPKPAPKAPAAKAPPADAAPVPGATSRPVRTRGSKPPVPPTFPQ